MANLQGFDANTVEPNSQDFSPLPAGDFNGRAPDLGWREHGLSPPAGENSIYLPHVCDPN